MPRASPLCIKDLPVLLDPSRASHRGVDCCDNCPRFPRRDDGAPPTERTNRSTTSKTAAMMPLSVAHGWKVACNGEAWRLDAARSRVGVSLRVALSWTRRALATSLPNCFSVGGSTSMISARLLRVDSISAAASGLSSEPSTSSKMRSASVHEKPRPAISSMTMGTPTRWAHHSSSKQYGRRSTSLVARSTSTTRRSTAVGVFAVSSSNGLFRTATADRRNLFDTPPTNHLQTHFLCHSDSHLFLIHCHISQCFRLMVK